MNPWTMLASALRQLPASVRRTLYTIVTAAGALLAVAQLAGWKAIGPVDLDAALKVYALVSSPTGFLALANVSPREAAPDDGGPDEWRGYDDRADAYLPAQRGADEPAYDSPTDEATFS